jgi:hypothetical protein
MLATHAAFVAAASVAGRHSVDSPNWSDAQRPRSKSAIVIRASNHRFGTIALIELDQILENQLSPSVSASRDK